MDKGTKIVGASTEPHKGTEIFNETQKGTKVIDKATKTEQPQVEVTAGQGDRDE